MSNRAFQPLLDQLDPSASDYVIQLVDGVLEEAIRQGASDIHIEPTGSVVSVRLRMDGVLQLVAELPVDISENVVTRLKVLADLLTYRMDAPQEGRIRGAAQRYGVELRISTFPTIYGERVVVRVFGSEGQLWQLDQIGLPSKMLTRVQRQLAQRTGLFLLTGPSGSGKTTTIYACLRYLVSHSAGQMQIATIEDPVEHAVPGVSQTQIRQGSEFGFPEGLRSLLRQDPEVIAVGEIRDRVTASIAVEASLTGHMVLSTVHAGSACGVISRLLEMGIEPFLITSGLAAVLNQRLVRRLCQACRVQENGVWRPASCSTCIGTGYRGRMLLAELVLMDGGLRSVVLQRGDLSEMEQSVSEQPTAGIIATARDLVASGETTQQEVARVLGTDIAMWDEHFGM